MYYLEPSLVSESSRRSKSKHNQKYICIYCAKFSHNVRTWYCRENRTLTHWLVSSGFPQSPQGRELLKHVVPQPIRGTQHICQLPHIIKSPYHPLNLLPLPNPACQNQQWAVWWRFGNAVVRTHGLSPGMYTPMPSSIQAITNQAHIITRANFNVSWVRNPIIIQRSLICAQMP